MRGKKTKPQTFYNHDEVLDCTAAYLSSQNRELLYILPFHEVYENIVEANPDVKFPKFSQYRNYILEDLTKNGLFPKGRMLTTEAAYRLLELYDIRTGDLECILRSNPPKIIDEDVIPCILSIPNSQIAYMITRMLAKKNNKSLTTQSRLLLSRICRIIKSEHKDVVIAAIPEPLSITEDRKCSICIYVRNTEQGREFIRSITAENVLVQYV